jgi:hypothetical protein
LTNIIEHNRRRIVDEQIIGCSRDGGIGTTTEVVVVSETKGGSGVDDDGNSDFTFGNDRALVRNNYKDKKKNKKEKEHCEHGHESQPRRC